MVETGSCGVVVCVHSRGRPRYLPTLQTTPRHKFIFQPRNSRPGSDARDDATGLDPGRGRPKTVTSNGLDTTEGVLVPLARPRPPSPPPTRRLQSVLVTTPRRGDGSGTVLRGRGWSRRRRGLTTRDLSESRTLPHRCPV